MPLPVSTDAAERQAFGVMFNHTSKDTVLARRLLEGSLALSPHPDWELPEVIDWRADPFHDRNWQAQYHMLRWLDPLRRRAEKGDAAAGEMWLKYAESWVISNPPNSRRALASWMNMVDGIRALELSIAVPFVSRMRPRALDWLSDAIAAHGAWLAEERHLGHSNHALHQHLGLFVCGAVLGDDSMMTLAEGRMGELFASAYDQQGVNAEGAIAYHMANYNWWSMARRRLETEGRPVPDAMAVLDLAPIELAHATKPDGLLVGIGDTDDISARFVQHPATKWVTSSGADGEPPEDLVRLYDAGYLFARSGWGDQEREFADETFWSVSFGAANRVHGHPDGSSMTFSSMGHEWITDPGKYQYGNSDMRTFCMSRAAHSLVHIPDREYDPESIVACTQQQTNDSTYDFTFVDEGYHGVTLKRRVIYSVSGEYAVVIDNVDSDAECTAVQNWQTAPGTSARVAKQGFELQDGDRQAAVFFTGTLPTLSIVQGESAPLGGWVATGWKKREAAPALKFTKSGTRFRFVTVLAAGFRDSKPQMDLVRNAPKGELRLRLDTGRVAEQIIIRPESSTIVGFYDDQTVEVEESLSTDAPALDPLDTQARKQILMATRRARRAGWEDTSPSRRAELAQELLELRRTFSTPEGVDLGLRAAISDLRMTSQAALGRLEIQKDRPGLINWENSPEFQPTAAKTPVISVYGAVAELPHMSVDTMVTYNLGSLVLPALVSPAPGRTLTVLFQTAVDRARVHLPIFQRLRFQKELAAGPVVAFGDPTLDMSRELRLGWYLGNEEIDLPRSIANATQTLARHLGADSIVLQGGSGGGFAALQVGARIPGSHVVAVNPQTDLRRYSARAFRSAMIAALGLRGADLPKAIEHRVSVMQQIALCKSKMNITLVMNTGDVFHEKNHAAPLRAAAEDASEVTLSDVTFDLGPGHKGLDNQKYGEVMRSVFDGIN